MMSADMLAKFADSLIPQLEKYVKDAAEAMARPLRQELDALKQKFAELPVPKDGVPGEKGQDGIDGKHGEKGEEGLQGPPGEKGDPGASGKDGADGEDGVNGQDGRDGIDGKDGTKGIDGTNGKDGLDGKDGESAYEIAVRKGFRGDESAFIESLRGEGGRDGRDGLKGDPGQNGADGFDGFNFRDVEIVANCDDDGNVTLAFTCQGVTKSAQYRAPREIHKGVFKSDQTYQRGDNVTAGGSVFGARCDNPKGTPGNSDDWILKCKRGRDGDRPAAVRQRDVNAPYKIGGASA